MSNAKNESRRRRAPAARPVPSIEPAAGEDRRWAEDVLPLVAKMMKLRGYTELRVEITAGGFRYEMTQEVSAVRKEGGPR